MHLPKSNEFPWRKYINNAFFLAFVGSVLAGTYFIVKDRNAKTVAANNVRRESICPPLLSIGRSSRDTLIIMKAEPLCNVFVLSNLK